eukprot:29396-Pelagococcus_subviridis.AAC.3
MMTQSESRIISGVMIGASKAPSSYFDASSPSTGSRTRYTPTSAPSTCRTPSAMTFASVTRFTVRLKYTIATCGCRDRRGGGGGGGGGGEEGTRERAGLYVQENRK